MSYRTILGRALRHRCPRCGEYGLFIGGWKMRARCPGCELDFAREPGFYLGSIYVNYGVTASLVVALYCWLYFAAVVPRPWPLWITAAFSVAFPCWFFRYARAIWLGFDQYWDPQ